MLSFKERASWTPAQARRQFRQNLFPLVQTGGISAAFTQVSVHIIPSSAAEHFAEFCRMNKTPCPIVYQSKPGEVSASPIAADSDIRTDQTAYGIFENGVFTKTVTDILEVPFDDFVAFYLGCSHSFELALSNAGLPVRHQQVDRSVPSYKTKIPCIPAGPFSGNVVASMRPMPRNLVQRAAEVTAVLDQVHGAPVHIGDPCWIGVKDVLHPEYDDEPNIQEGDVFLFWGCGTTAMEALTRAQLPLMISLSPNANCCNFITDLRNEAFNKMNTPKGGTLETRVVFICEQPVLGSLVSEKALELIQQLEKLGKKESPNPVIGDFNGKPDEPADSFVKAALRLSHASSVAIVTLNDVSTKEGSSVLSIIKSVMATKKEDIVLLVPAEKVAEMTNAISICVELKLFEKSIHVRKIDVQEASSKDDIVKISRRLLSTMESFKLERVDHCKFTALIGPDKEGGFWVESAVIDVDVDHVARTSECTWPGEVIAGALYILNCCPTHSCYLRRGLGQHKPLQQSEFIMSSEEFRILISKFEVSCSTEDVEVLIEKINMSASNGLKCLGGEA
ncbi:uncharacterized protein [Montipora capricornis]|uniref:uncharacterized protein n=1 Tax=Montipora capricornis TaxID=246305 RepID=UPI0035F10230